MHNNLRYYYRCMDCLSVAATAEQLPPNRSATLRGRIGCICGLCNGPLDYMGAVVGRRLTVESSECPCDARCTNARGPDCECSCGGANHGTKRVVKVIRDAGAIPRLCMPDTAKARAIAKEWRAARLRVQTHLDELGEERRSGWLSDNKYNQQYQLRYSLSRASKAKTHAGRMKHLVAVELVGNESC